MSPEVQVLVLNAVALGGAYLVFYPGLKQKTLAALAWGDLGITGLVLAVTAALFWGTGTEFALGPWRVNWLVFALVTGAAMEMPLMWWFWRRHMR